MKKRMITRSDGKMPMNRRCSTSELNLLRFVGPGYSESHIYNIGPLGWLTPEPRYVYKYTFTHNPKKVTEV
jgi:hypothetical protein